MYPSISDSRTVTGIVIVSGLAILAIIFYSNIAAYYEIWTAENSVYSHGLLFFPISIILFIREWKVVGDYAYIRFRPLLTLLLFSLSVIWLIFNVVHIQTASQITFIFILCFYIFSLIGIKNNLRLAFPLFIILTATPIWSIFSQPLQEPTAFAVNEILKITGFTSFQENYLIYIPEGVFEVGNTCSGLRFQIAAITATTLFVYTARYSLLKSLAYIAASSLIAFISNTIRIYIVVLSGHYTSMTHSLLEDHIWLGWLVFFCSFTIFIIITGLFEARSSGVSTGSINKIVGHKFQDFNLIKSSLLVLLTVCIAGIGPITSWLIFSPNINIDKNSDKFNLNIQKWNLIETNNNWKPVWLSSDFELINSYTHINSRKVDLFISTYFQQAQGREIINDMNKSFDNKTWKIFERKLSTVKINDGTLIPIDEEIIINTQNSKRINWKFYYVGGMFSNNPLTAILHNIISTLKGRTDATVLIISTQYNSDIEEMRNTLEMFLNDNIGEIKYQLDSMLLTE